MEFNKITMQIFKNPKNCQKEITILPHHAKVTAEYFQYRQFMT